MKRQSNTRQGKSPEGKTREGKTREGKTREGKTRAGKARGGKTREAEIRMADDGQFSSRQGEPLGDAASGCTGAAAGASAEGTRLPAQPSPLPPLPARSLPVQFLPAPRRPWFGLRLIGIGDISHQMELGTDPAGKAWFHWLAPNAALALVGAAYAANASRAGDPHAVQMFYLAVGWMLLPIVVCLILPNTARSERLAALLVATLGLFALRVIRAPLYFVDHDEYLHWVTAQQLIETQRLFGPNSLFPIGPDYPGLSILTAALAQLSGLSLFVAGLIVLLAARLVFVAGLFLLYERLTGSTRVAALAAMFYMGCSTFVFFDTHFAYESVAVGLMALVLFIDARLSVAATERPLFFVAAALLVLFALAITHHMTSYCLAAILIGILALAFAKSGRGDAGPHLWLLAAAAAALPAWWSWLNGNPGASYLGPMLDNGLAELNQLLHFETGRKLFTADDGTLAPLWQRATTIGAVGLVSLGLALGFFRSLAWAGMPLALGRWPGLRHGVLGWSNSRLVLLTLFAFGFPLSIVLRLTRSGWEIGNRLAPFAFLGVGLVLAVLVVTRLQGRSRNPFRAMPTALAATIIVIGGIISAEGPRVLVPARYQVSADAASIEPMAIEAAEWTRQWLGPGHHFTADRINRLLLATHGRQLMSTTLQHGYDTSLALVADELGPTELDALTKVGIDYLFADLRLTTARPVVGAYFDNGLADQMLDGPPKPAALLKFEAIAGVSRPFDNGYNVIYDVRSLSGRD